MSKPTGYTQLPSGEFMKDSDSSGPYVFDGTTMLLSATGTGGGGGGGGGAVTVADGADVAEGAIADAAVTAGATGSVSAKLRAISRDVGAPIGIVTETAPATDTASSGLNGRLQRVAQRLTSLITALGTPFQAGGALGAGSALIGKVGIDQTTPGTTNLVSIGTNGTVAINAAVPAGANVIGKVGIDQTTPGTTNLVAVTGAAVTRTDKSNTITAGGTAQTLIASNASRKGFEIQNQSAGNLWFSSLATAVQGQPSILLVPGQMYETPLSGSGTGAVSIIGATTGQAFAAREWT